MNTESEFAAGEETAGQQGPESESVRWFNRTVLGAGLTSALGDFCYETTIVSWFGKGLRGPLRDAIVIQSIKAETRGRAFDFHRAMDTLGAVIGPLLGVILLSWAQGQKWDELLGPFRLAMWLSVMPGVLAVLAFLFLVKDPEESRNPELKFFTALRGLPGNFKRCLRAVGVFGIGDFSHSLLILAATQLLTPTFGIVRAAQLAGLLYVLRNITQLICSYPIGVLADRYGSRRVLLAGYVLGSLTAAITAMAFVQGTSTILVPD